MESFNALFAASALPSVNSMSYSVEPRQQDRGRVASLWSGSGAIQAVPGSAAGHPDATLVTISAAGPVPSPGIEFDRMDQFASRGGLPTLAPTPVPGTCGSVWACKENTETTVSAVMAHRWLESKVMNSRYRLAAGCRSQSGEFAEQFDPARPDQPARSKSFAQSKESKHLG